MAIRKNEKLLKGMKTFESTLQATELFEKEIAQREKFTEMESNHHFNFFYQKKIEELNHVTRAAEQDMALRKEQAKQLDNEVQALIQATGLNCQFIDKFSFMLTIEKLNPEDPSFKCEVLISNYEGQLCVDKITPDLPESFQIINKFRDCSNLRELVKDIKYSCNLHFKPQIN